MAKVNKQQESEEPPFDVAAALPVHFPEAPPVALTLPLCRSTECEDSITQLMNMIRDVSSACDSSLERT